MGEYWKTSHFRRKQRVEEAFARYVLGFEYRCNQWRIAYQRDLIGVIYDKI